MDPIKVDFSGKGAPKEVVIPPEKKILKIIISLIVALIGGAVAYYFMLPAINLKELEFYYFIGIVLAIYIAMTVVTTKAFAKPEYIPYVKSRVSMFCFVIELNSISNNTGYKLGILL